ncbi:MAG: hypothetical protein L6R42_000250 [Xanthoria sp. 1 TBL-2021]|nr:MAG: hypothetical protein L6R42_000250 [Xanthoria sp. 1 TBL-2021]
MGMLHDGHLSLVRLAAQQTPSVLVSIYANPSQLTSDDGKQSYPSTLTADLALLEDLNEELRSSQYGAIKAVFAPTDEEMYPCSSPEDIPRGVGSFVNILPLSSVLEGADRPSHFAGVATVCLKLFNAVRPDKVYFGEKDCQQTVIVKRLVRDFLLDIEVVVGETVREVDGLALSSRNGFLGTRRRAVATVLFRALDAARNAYEAGILERNELLSLCKQVAEQEHVEQGHLLKPHRADFEVIYFELVEQESMISIGTVKSENGAVICGAVRLLPLEVLANGEEGGRQSGGDTIRLIDSILLEPRKTL